MKKQKNLAVIISLFFTATFILLFVNCYYTIYYPIDYNEIIVKYSSLYDLDKTLVASLINVESHYRPDAVSYAGAIGLMQLMPSTGEYIAKLLKEEYLDANLFNPEINIKWGCYYLRYLKNKFVYDDVALSAYNAGEGTVNIWLKDFDVSKDGKHLSTIPYKSTQNYVNKIIKGKKYYLKRI